VVPVGMGAFAFADAGRVFLDGDSPGGWHGRGSTPLARTLQRRSISDQEECHGKAKEVQ
jgi:hypothetical protein